MCSILTYTDIKQTEEKIDQMLEKMANRGPDMRRTLKVSGGWMGFNRLSIMGPDESGMQPFIRGEDAAICNGELYGFRNLKDYLISLGESFQSGSDCEIILPLYRMLGVSMFAFLDAEFACIIWDGEKKNFVAARDPIGIRPLYYGYDEGGAIVFASEPAPLVGICEKIQPFPPGHYYADGEFVCYRDATLPKNKVSKGLLFDSKEKTAVLGTDEIPGEGGIEIAGTDDDIEVICAGIREKLTSGVLKRLDADVPVGFLLSGGLDSSLVCGIAAKYLKKPIETFAIGMDIDAIDLKYAKKVAQFIGSNHHEVIISKEDVIAAVEPVVKSLGTYDITTVRASIGMYLLCKWIRENTSVRVILTGEISDELFGYKYTDFAPDADAFQKEAEKRIREIHMYDVLRADRCISANSLEARVPFGDLDFVSYVMGIDPAKKMNTYGLGKYLLRHAFDGMDLIPQEILMREKAAFSDAVGHSLRDDLMEKAESLYTDVEFEVKRKAYTHATPFTKESLWYRQLFEKYYPGQSEMVADFWMPNKEWDGCNVNDPSARVLSNYGASGE